MRTFRIHAAMMAASAVALLSSSTSFAHDTTTTTSSPQPTPAPQSAPQPMPAAPAATTQTTGYAVPVNDVYAERSLSSRPNRTLLSTGGGLFVLSYGASVVVGAISDRDADKNLFIPVVGPWIDLANRDCNVITPCSSNEDLAKAMIITSGIVQGASALMVLGSLVIPETTTISERATTAKASKPKVTVTPVSYTGGAGVGAVGRF